MAALVLVGLLVAPGLKRSVASVTGRFAVAQTLMAIALLVAVGHVDGPMVLAGMRFAGVASFLICMPLYARLFQAAGLDRALIGLLGRVRPCLRVPVLLAGAIAGSMGLSFGTISMFGLALPKKSRPSAAVLARGVVISMLLAPTTGSVAAVMTVFPELDLVTILTATVPLAAAAFGLACLMSGGIIEVPARPETGGIPVRPWPVLMAVVMVAGLSWAGAPLLAAIAWTAVVVSGLWALVSGGRAEIREVATLLSATANRLSPEILLFIATGWLGVGVLALAPSVDGMAVWLDPLRPVLPLTIMLGMALLAVLGIHPMVVFGIIQPVVSQFGTGLPVLGEYAMWVIAFVLSLLVAPISVLTAFSAAASGLTAWQVSVRLQGGYALALALITAAYIAVRF
ncbi:MAG: hypothetical protein H7Y60_14190 [Rhodospirillaceae bacterium]|nr:hypothetical protein [Rhodospirillales bacterium]